MVYSLLRIKAGSVRLKIARDNVTRIAIHHLLLLTKFPKITAEDLTKAIH